MKNLIAAAALICCTATVSCGVMATIPISDSMVTTNEQEEQLIYGPYPPNRTYNTRVCDVYDRPTAIIRGPAGNPDVL